MKNILFLPVAVLLFLSCSSMPKDEKDAGVKDKKEQAAAVLEHGNNEYLWENHNSSINQYSNAFRLSATVDWQEGMIRSLIALSRSSDALGRAEDSLIYLERAEYLLQGTEDISLSLSAANRRSEWSLFNESPERALTLNDSAISIASKMSGREAGETWRIRAAILKRQGLYPEALAAADQALKIDEKTGALRESASDQYIRASILSLSGNTEQAVAAMQDALTLDKQIENTPAIAQDLYALGLIYEKAGNREEAQFYFRRSLLVYESAGALAIPERLTKHLEDDSEKELWAPQDKQ